MSRAKIEINLIANERVKCCIQDSGMSQKNFAEKIFCSQQHLSRIVNGKAPVTWETAARISELLPGISAAWIMGGEFKSENARIDYIIHGEAERAELIERLMQLHKYSVSVYKTFAVEKKDSDEEQHTADTMALQEWRGSSCHLTYPAGITDAEMLDRFHSNYPETIMCIEHSSGVKRYIEQRDYLQLVKDIDDYIKMRLEFLCRFYADDEK